MITCHILLFTPINGSADNHLRIHELPEGFALYTGSQTATICVSPQEALVVKKAAQLLGNDIRCVTGKHPLQVTVPTSSPTIIIGTLGCSPLIDTAVSEGLVQVDGIRNGWEQFVIKCVKNHLYIIGSDRRGTAYGVVTLSEALGVSPWYWWADVPVKKRNKVYVDADYVSKQPSVKYRGIFINDEDWGLKPWASKNYERGLGDIGPKTYAKVCELLLRLKANMLAPAMHPCTGAFYSHPENKLVADTFGIIITTSHCEPLLLNNAAKSEWDVQKDGDWNYMTNGENIRKKWEQRLSEASKYENIYTVAMRGLHDTGLRGDISEHQRVTLLEQVISDQRKLLEKHIDKSASEIPQIFVPYKETMDIYENGLNVPDDITLVWVDDNYGYMKRVAAPKEQKRAGRSGVYYHLSYLGAPHDYLWLNTTPPVLMYEELKKAYDTGADRYWLLNVGDIKPMELGIQTFMDMAWDFLSFDEDKAYRYQAHLLSNLFGSIHEEDFQLLLDNYYRLAWSRKPEFMGYEYEWDNAAYSGLHDSDFSFFTGTAQQRLTDYRQTAEKAQAMIPSEGRDAYFQLVEFPISAAYQMNRKFLMAQLNHEQANRLNAEGANWAALQMYIAYDSIQALNKRYNEQCHGKWQGIMTLPTGWCALYQEKPAVTYNPEEGVKEPQLQTTLRKPIHIDLSNPTYQSEGIRLIKGIGLDWVAVQMTKPTNTMCDASSHMSPHVTYSFVLEGKDSVEVQLSTVPFWPLYDGRENRIGISIDDGKPQVFNNLFAEYSRLWKNQVLKNEASCRFRFAIDPKKKNHTITIITGDPGMMVQQIMLE